MSFSTWKKRSKVFAEMTAYFARVAPGRSAYLEDVAEAAYKAGQRDARKVTEQVAINAIHLAHQLSSK